MSSYGNTVTAVTGASGRVASSGGRTPQIDLAASGVTLGTYTNPSSLTVDTYGRITSAVSGDAPIASVVGTANQISVMRGYGIPCTLTDASQTGCCSDGTNVWVTDAGFTGGAVWKIPIATGIGQKFGITISSPEGCCSDGTNIWVADNSAAVWKVPIATGVGVKYTLTGAYGTGCCSDGTNIWVADKNAAVWKVPIATPGSPTKYTLTGAWGIGCCFDGTNVWVADKNSAVWKVPIATGVGVSYPLSGASPRDCCWKGADIWVADSNQAVWKVPIATPSSPTKYTLAGALPYKICTDGTSIWVADANGDLLKVSASTGVGISYHITTGNLVGCCFDGVNSIWACADSDEAVYKCPRPVTDSAFIGLSPVGTAGSTTYSSITTDAYGRVTAASSGTAPVTSVSGTTGRITSTGGATPVLDLATAGPGAGSVTNASITTDAYGRVTARSSGTAPVTSVSGTTNQIAVTGTTTPTIGFTATPVMPNGTTATTQSAGDNSTKLATTAYVKTAADVGPAPYVSADTTISTLGAYTFTHGLGREPNFVALKLICQTGENGYSAGDHLMINPDGISFNTSTVTNQGGIATRVDSTQIRIQMATALCMPSLSFSPVGNMVNATFANWRLRVIAF